MPHDGRCYNVRDLTSGFATTNRPYRQPRCLDSPQRTASPMTAGATTFVTSRAGSPLRIDPTGNRAALTHRNALPPPCPIPHAPFPIPHSPLPIPHYPLPIAPFPSSSTCIKDIV
ncbi:MAG: hypothetical protein KME31_17770 [Tolypothrix carrinoi HA7290-LM1]|nr:hypothetical protein [Tolypothrix carrinoi HA7290-LM1]